MSGGEIFCGTFEASDKSGSAVEGVLRDMVTRGFNDQSVLAFQATFEAAEEAHVEITSDLAQKILPCFVSYRSALINDIGHEDWTKEVIAEEQAGMDGIKAKYGESRGWRLYCVTDLIGACQTSLAEDEPIYISFS